MSLIRDDEKRQFVYCELRYESRVQSGIKHLQERRRREKETLEFYVDTEEKAIAVRRMQRDKETEERGGSSEEKMKRMKWIPRPDSRCG
jgi:uridine kinase